MHYFHIFICFWETLDKCIIVIEFICKNDMYIRKNLYKYEQEVCKDTSTTAAHEEHEEKKEIT